MTSAGRGRLVVFGALLAVLVLLCTGQAAGAAERQAGHSHTTSQQSSKDGKAHPAAARKTARKGAEHHAAGRKAAERKAAAHKTAQHHRKAAERRAVEADPASQSSDAARPAAASRAVSQDAANRRAAEQAHRARQAEHHRSKATKKDAAEQSLADRKAADLAARDNRQADEDSVGSVDSPAALPARGQSAAQAAAQAAAQLAEAARRAAEQQVAQQLAAEQAHRPGAATGQPVHEVGLRSSGTSGSTNAQQPAVSLSPAAAGHPGPARPRSTRSAGSLPHRIISEPARPIIALATASLSVGSEPALLVLIGIAIAGLLLVAAGTRRSSVRG